MVEHFGRKFWSKILLKIEINQKNLLKVHIYANNFEITSRRETRQKSKLIRPTLKWFFVAPTVTRLFGKKLKNPKTAKSQKLKFSRISNLKTRKNRINFFSPKKVSFQNYDMGF